MSHKLAALIRSKRCGGVVRKAVLGALADRASDDGRGIFASARVLAGLADVSPSTLHGCLNTLLADQLVRRAGTRKCASGHTVIYDLDVEAIRALPDVEAIREPETSERKNATGKRARSPGAGGHEAAESAPGAGDLGGQGLREPESRSPGAGDKPVLNLDDDTDEKRPAYLVVVEAVNHPSLDPHKQHQLVTTSKKVEGWLRAGATIEEVISTVRAVLQRKGSGPVRTWGYFDAAVRDAVANRLASEQDQPAIQPSTSRRAPSRSLTEEDHRIIAGLHGANLSADAQRFTVEITGAAGASAIGRASLRARYRELYSEPDWAFRLDFFRTERHWPAQWGPQPGEPGYRGPSQHTSTEGEAHP